jgi:hypothetical protein
VIYILCQESCGGDSEVDGINLDVLHGSPFGSAC